MISTDSVGRKVSDVVGKYIQGVNTRVSKLADIKTRIESIPPSDRTEVIKKSMPYLHR